MRITNSMITSNMLLNINRNASYLDKLNNQISTGKLIQYPSDNPILAARILKFRTNIQETEQYQKNVVQGTSWMEITEKGFSNVNDIVEKIRELCVQGATDSYSFEDRKKISTDIESMVNQIGAEMNITYAGRYVFSGYRTDKAPILEEDSTDQYKIEQSFKASDLQNTKSYQREDETSIPIVNDINVLKIAYKDATNLSIAGFSVNTITNVNSDPNAYIPAENTVNFIKETGELVFHDNDVKDIPSTGLTVSYNKENIVKGELNPEVYFKCTNVTTGKSYAMDEQSIQYEFGTNTRIDINSLSKNVYTDKMFADLKGFVSIINEVTLSNTPQLEEKYKLEGFTDTALNDEVTKQLTSEKQMLQAVLQDRFSDMLKQLDDHTSNVSKEHADLGSRMNRLELIGNRLKDDELTYTKLLSENEDTDYAKTIMLLSAAESVYQASLQTGAKIIQTSLVNFIN